MNRKRLGRTGIVVTDICMGTMTFGLQADEKTSFAIMDRALEAGIDFFDTAELYPVPPSAELFGVTEQIVGKWLKGQKRGEIIIASKVTGPGHGWFRPPVRNGFTALDRRQIFQACEDSLKRLQTDYIDLYQTHWPDHGMQQEETLGALTDLIDQGKIRAWGSSNETCWGVMKNLWEAEKHGLARMATVQNNFSLINRRCESELAQVCRKEAVSLLPYSPLGGGVLCGKYNGGALPQGARFTDYILNGGPRQKRMAARFVNERSLETTARLQVIAADLGVSVTALALAWSKQHDFVASTIVGATTVAQLNESLAAADLVLSDETLARINEIDEAIPCAMTEDGLRRL
ncbi:aldo/keto reductase [Prosthecobacter sp.]|uniref:aldo/keto reductase n=1 Tax=Prosthecobacter sp. TaxID=1965333 RepID=UPI003784EC33